MITEHYNFDAYLSHTIYLFQSEGKETVIKAVQFTEIKLGLFNLGLADYKNGGLDFDVNSGNHDARKVFNTVAVIVLDFFQNHSGVRVLIMADEKKRLHLYNRIFQVRWNEIQAFFDVWGLLDDKLNLIEPYMDDMLYEGFILSKKN